MPLVRCGKDNKGWKYGRNNKTCFTGKDAKKRALKQGIKIHIEENGGDVKKAYKSFKREMSKADIDDLQEILSDLESTDAEIELISDVLDLSMNQRMQLSISRRIGKCAKNV